MSDPDDLSGVTPLGEAPPAEPPDPGPPEGEGSPLARAAALPTNDVGNGQRFALHFGEDAMFVPRVGWHVWTGQVWQADPDALAVRARAQRLAELIAQEVPHLRLSRAEAQAVADRAGIGRRIAELEAGERDEAGEAELAELRRREAAVAALVKRVESRRSRHLAFALSTGNSNRIGNALLESQTALAVPVEALDAAPLDVNTPTGVLRFRRVTAEGMSPVADVTLVPHARAQRMTKMTAAPYDPDATCPLFDAFLERIQPDPEMRAFLARWFGLSMLARVEQKLAFFYGSGANGKSVLTELMEWLLGSYAATARIESLTGTNRRGGGDATPDLIPLIGARMVRTSEPDEGERLQEGLIKELTGGEPLLVRALHADFVKVVPVFTLTISGNHKPEIRGTDDGIWRRVLLVPFDEQIPEHERDPDLGAKLRAEAAGVLNWVIAGALDLIEAGLQTPARVADATAEYRADSDPLALFLVNCCVVTGDAGDALLSKDLVNGFNYWLLERGEGAWKPRTVSLRLKDKSRRWRHPETGRGFTDSRASLARYVGIRFTDAFDRRLRAAPVDRAGQSVPPAISPDPA